MATKTKNPPNAQIMDDVYFLMCASKLKCDSGNDIETIGLRGSEAPYEISFYGDECDNYKLVVEDFGVRTKIGWVQMVPSEKHIEIMQNQLNKKADSIYRERSEKERNERRCESEYREETRYGTPGAIYDSIY